LSVTKQVFDISAPQSHLTMHRTIGLTEYYRTMSDGLMGYRANGQMD